MRMNVSPSPALLVRFLLTLFLVSAPSLIVQGCGGSSVCSQLDYVNCPETSVVPCGCYKIATMTGGITGGEHPLPDEMKSRVMLIRPNGSVEFYHGDTLNSAMKYVAVRDTTSTASRGTISLLLDVPDQDGWKYSIRVDDRNRVWYGPIDVADAFYFGYVRQK